MARLLLGLWLLSGMASACPALWGVLSQKQHIAPIALMQKIEKQFPGVISDFSTKITAGQLVYQVEVINPQKKLITELTLTADNGQIINKKYEQIEHDDSEQLKAALKIETKKLQFSEIVQEAMQNHPAQLIEAELDHDLGINYLELELINDTGKHKLAFNIDQQQPLPLLTWD